MLADEKYTRFAAPHERAEVVYSTRMLASGGSRLVLPIAALGAAFFVHGAAEAHFVLSSPPAMTEQNGVGDPQKAPPCGDNGDAVATGIVTTYQAGETITVTIDEAIFHPGHYRIALAVDEASLPAEPIVTPDNNSPCGSAPIDAAPVYPVLADGVFEHTEAFGEPQSIEITLPDDVTCDNCVLQIIQFMSDHGLNNPGGCYYHHCAHIALEADPVGATSTTGDDAGATTGDGGATTATTMTTASSMTSADGTAGNADTGDGGGNDDAEDAGPGPEGSGTVVIGATDSAGGAGDSDGGCSCSAPAGGSAGLLWGVFGLLGLGLRRRFSASNGRARLPR